MDSAERRRLLATRANPDTGVDYVVTITVNLAPVPGLGTTGIAIRYVPDRRVLDPDCLSAYTAALTGASWDGLESLALAIRDDLNNEAVPRWLQVAVSGPSRSILGQQILVEDRQPRWDNPGLLARLNPL